MTVLFVLVTIVLFFAIDLVVQRTQAKRAPAPAAAVQGAAVRLPGGVFFSRSHTWMNLFPTGHVWMGVDDFVTRLLDAPRVRFLKEAGSAVEKGEPILALEDGGHSLTVRAPVSGTILAWNHELQRHPELLRKSPFCEGWTCDFRPSRAGEMKALLLGDETRGWMQEEFRRLRDVLAGASPELSPAMLQDGGPPVAGAMKHVGGEVWDRFQKEFLEVR